MSSVVHVGDDNSSLVQVRSHLVESEVVGLVESILIPENARRINKWDLCLDEVVRSVVSIIASKPLVQSLRG